MAKVVDLLEKYYKNTNYNCAEAVFSAAAEAWGLDVPKDTVRAMGCFGGGMGCGIVCGAVTGGSAALSYKFVEGDGGHTSPMMMKRVRTYIRLVRETYGSEECKHLKPQFYSKDERCFVTISKIAEILDQVYEMDLSREESRS